MSRGEAIKSQRVLRTRLARAFAQCPAQSAMYGKCMVQNIDSMGKDSCAKEFQFFQQCMKKHAGK